MDKESSEHSLHNGDQHMRMVSNNIERDEKFDSAPWRYFTSFIVLFEATELVNLKL